MEVIYLFYLKRLKKIQQNLGGTTQASTDKSEVTVVIPKYYTLLQYTPHINKLKSTFFGDNNVLLYQILNFYKCMSFDRRICKSCLN